MRILCAYSGVDFTCEHFPSALLSREAYHPIFNLPQKKLISYLGKWGGGELTPTDCYLLFLATLRSSDLVEFRVPAVRTTRTDSIIAHNMESLMKTVLSLNTVTNPGVIFPHYVISPETKDLDNVQYWIQNWKESYADFKEGKGKDYDDRKLVHREAALERLIRSPHRPISSYAHQIADWASIAGDFPTFQTINRLTNTRQTCGDYWKQIIIYAATEEKLFAINRADLEELLEHCETNISYSGIFGHTLFTVLRKALEKQKNFLGLGDLDISRSTYQILTSTDSVQDANLRAAINSAPLERPEQKDYPTKFSYLRAKLNYEMAQKYAAASPAQVSPIVSTTISPTIKHGGTRITDI